MAKNLKLKLARVELDLTQGQLAEAVGGDAPDYWFDRGGKIQSQSLALPVYLQMFRKNPRPTILGGRRW